MLFSLGQKIQHIKKFEQNRLFFFTFLISFFMAFLAQKLTYTIDIYSTFCLAQFLIENMT